MNSHPSLSRLVQVACLLLSLAGLGFMLAGCPAPAPPRVLTPAPLPEHPLYVLATSIGADYHNELVIVDSDAWQITQRTRILKAGPWGISQDPQGRIWIGYGLGPDGDRRVQVFAADGTLVKTLRFDQCLDPYLPAQFAAGRAFVACLQTGFYATVLVLDLDSLEVEQMVDVHAPAEDYFLLLTTGGLEDYFLMVGNGQQSNRVFLMDTQILEVSAPLEIPAGNFVKVLPFQERFLLINLYPEERNDLIVVDPAASPSITVQRMMARSPVWGDITDNQMYVYHDVEAFNVNIEDSSRAVSRMDLESGESELWPLPDDWLGRDLAVVNDQIILAYSGPDDTNDGLYQLDPESGALTQVLALPGAFHLLAPEK